MTNFFATYRCSLSYQNSRPLSSPLARRKKYQKFLEGLKITTKPQLIKMIGESRVLGNSTKDTTIKCMAEIVNLQ